MMLSAQHARPIQNMGLVNRLVRFLMGAGILAYFVLFYAMNHPVWTLGWQVAAVAVSIYPILTAMVGWDPFYALFNVRSCNDSGRNQCGTLPYQIKAMLGHAPKYCDIDTEHSLEACHDEPEERPHHAMWRVNQKPMIYPDEEDWDDYFKRHPELLGVKKLKKAS